ncbi:hypothetical protein QTL97_04095 [Sporosarcina thermotolerans]|uniref:Uncharacterized protein n=1 Tax=Sporosarcina thermotolerans TaxID=633404 RepID=A0AAW9A779_9BACL|nr:hypothetical protein [Sporosarcina thermotolerans]MDW0116104.1 hypothetical protein [Sporosarcina thermotolerans]WHT48073.1 hypothetical protein QNH10_18875 [Sporosarcina thermotolerans]
MEIIRYSADPHSTVRYIKANLDLLDDVTSFEVYFNDEDIPEIYRNVPDIYLDNGKREFQLRNYTFILRNEDSEREIWLSGATCGYSGSGPSATIEILQLLGIKFNYDRITSEKKIIEKDLVTYHDLNIHIYRPTELWNSRGDKIFTAKMSFETAAQKYEAKKLIEQKGYLRPLIRRSDYERIGEIEAYYFVNTPYSTRKEWPEYATNNTLTLNRAYSQIGVKTVKEIIENIGYAYNVKLGIETYEKMW